METNEKSRVLDMTQGDPFRLVLQFSMPLFCSNLLQQLYNLTDTALAGHLLGSAALAEIGATGNVVARYLRGANLIAREQDVEVDLSAFETELQAQKERSRNAAAVDTDDWKELIHIKQSEFIGYDTLSAEVKIARYRRVSSKGRVSYQLVFDRTPFYGNSGGQIGDIGYIETANGSRSWLPRRRTA